MDTSISVRVFEWRGELWLAVDRVHSAAHRRYAPRDRLASFHVRPMREVSEPVACLWLLEQLTLWVNAGCPNARREAAPASPVGDRRGHRAIGAPRRASAESALPSQTEPPSLEARDGEAVSDGLKPLGTQPSLF